MTQRIDPFFFEYDAKNWTFFFFNITQRIEPLFEYDSKNWISFWVWLKKSNSFLNTTFLNTTQWIEPIFLNVSQIEIFGWKIVKKKTKLIFSHDPKNRTRFFSIWLKELNLFRLDSKIRCYSVWPKELNFVWIGLTELDPFSWIWLRELKFFLGFFTCLLFSKMMQRINWTLFSLNMTQRIEPFLLWMWRQEFDFFLEYDAKNWTLFLFDAKKRTFISRYEWLQELYFSNKKYSMNWTFEIWLKELNIWTMCQKKDSENGSKNWTFCFSQNVSKNWIFFKKKKMLKELNLSFIWTTLLHDSMNWTFFSIWLEELSLFQYDSKELDFFFFFWIWLKNLNLRLSMTQRSEPFFEHDSKNRPFF